MHDVLFQVIEARAQGVVIRTRIEVHDSAHEAVRRIRQVELERGGDVAFQFKERAVDVRIRTNDLLVVDARRFHLVLFDLVQCVFDVIGQRTVHIDVGKIEHAVQLPEVDVEVAGALAVVEHGVVIVGIREFEAVRAVELCALVSMFREIGTQVGRWFRDQQFIAAACCQENRDQPHSQPTDDASFTHVPLLL